MFAGLLLAAITMASGAAAYPIQPGSLALTSGSLQPGATASLSGGGFAPGVSVSLYVYSAPTLLTTTNADATGAISVTVTIPANLSPANHTVRAIGPAPGGGTTELSLGFVVAAAGAGSGGLPVTGFPVLPVLGLAILVLAVGATTVVAARRRG